MRSEPSPMPEAVCSLCLTAPRNIRVGPCGHASLCSSCYPKFMQANTLCPICREPITSHTMSDAIVREPTYLSDFSGATSITRAPASPSTRGTTATRSLRRAQPGDLPTHPGGSRARPAPSTPLQTQSRSTPPQTRPRRPAPAGSFLPLAHGTELSNSRHDNRQPAHHHPDSDEVSRDCFIRNFKYLVYILILLMIVSVLSLSLRNLR